MLLLLLAACQDDPEKAPATMEQLVIDLLLDFATEEGDAAAQELRTWMDAHADDDVDSYSLSPLDEDDVSDLEHSDELDVPAMLAMAIPARLAGNMDGYVATVPLEDQTFCDPTGYSQWDRTILSGTAAGFLAGGDLETDSDIVKTSFFIDIPYPMREDYHWISSDDGDILVSRSWITEAGWDDSGENGVLGGFTVELWVPDGDSMLWLTATWTLVESIVGDDEFLYDQTVTSVRKMYETMEAYTGG